MEQSLQGRRIAILVENGFEQVELTEPKKAIEQAGGQADVISPVGQKVKGWNFVAWGDEIGVDVPLSEADVDAYDALMLPGGVMNPDKLRVNRDAVRFVRAFFDAGKPVAVICHGPWTLIDAGVVAGRTMTSWPSVATDLKNAGARWVDEPVAIDGGLVSSRKPDDLPAFIPAMLDAFASARPARRAA